MRVGILGPLLLEDGGRPVELSGQRLRALMVRLAADPGRWLGADTLAGAVWGEDLPADPTAALQSLFSRLRRQLPEPRVVETGPAGYRLAIDPSDVDAHRFEHLAEAGRNDAGPDPERATRELREALALWRGPALADAADAEWVAPRAARLEELRLAALETRLATDLRLGRAGEVLGDLDALAAGNPLREDVAALRIRALHAAGRRADALAAYDAIRRRLADELGLDPSAALREAHLAVLQEPPETGPPAPARVRGNLRATFTTFIGRDDDVARLGALLAGSRLVTLTGPGGTGKTRLAVEAARTFADRVPDGVWLVELAPVTDGEDVAAAVLTALGLREASLIESTGASAAATRRPDAFSRLVNALTDRETVIILDNCEHLVEAAADLVDRLLSRSPGLRVLATSREPLGLFGESLAPIAPLPRPAPDATPEQALATPSVRLFADRARDVRPGFEVTEENVGAVVEICRRLDGLPLAIELAAARTRALPVAAVAQRLGNRFRLLTGGSRTAVARHQTLRAVVDWSWDLLEEEERRLAEALAVLSGGITPPSAAAVLAARPGTGRTVEDVEELLFALADKSLLQTLEGPGPEGTTTRYRMLETIREYGLEQLAGQGMVDDVRLAHARFFRNLAVAAEPHLRAHEQVTWLRYLRAERDNLTAALRWSVEAGQTVIAMDMAGALGWFWNLLGRHEEAAGWLDQALAMPEPERSEWFAMSVVVYGATMAGTSVGSERLDRVKELTARIPSPEGRFVHPVEEVTDVFLAMLTRDDELALAALTRPREVVDPWTRGLVAFLATVLAENMGRIDLMRTSVGPALAAFEEVGDRWGVGMAMSMSANLRSLDGDVFGAAGEYDRAVALLGELEADEDRSFLKIQQARALLWAGDLDGAVAAAWEGVRIAEQHGSPSAALFGRSMVALVLRRRGDLGEARTMLEPALARAEGLSGMAPQALAMMHVTLACVDVAEDKMADAVAHLRRAWTLAMDEARDMPVVASVAVTIAAAALGAGDPETAARRLGAADVVRGVPDLGDPDAVELVAALEVALGADRAAQLRAESRAVPREAALRMLRDAVGA